TFTAGNQQRPAVAVDAAGDFVIAWQSQDQDGSSDGVYAQRYSAAGVAQGGEFRVNTFTTGLQASPVVAVDAAGDFVVAWESLNQASATSGFDVYAQRYSATGLPSGAEFRVNNLTAGNQEFPT